MTTSLYAALLALLFIALSVHVIRGRRTLGAALGDANDIHMQRRIRAHGNFVEYTPLFLIMMTFAERGHVYVWVLHLLGIVFLTGRVMHAFSLLFDEQYNEGKLVGNPTYRIAGMMITFGCLGFLSLTLIVQYIGHFRFIRHLF